MNVSDVGRLNKVEHDLKCAVLIVYVNEFWPVNLRNGDENVMKKVVSWGGCCRFCDDETSRECEWMWCDVV